MVGPKAARELMAFADAPEPPAAERGQVDVMIGKLALATAQARVSPDEAEERLGLYWLALNDIPVADLRWAFAELIKTATFLPTPAEVRRKALFPGDQRRFAKSRARHLVWLHKREWRDPADILPPEEVKELLATVKLSVGQ